MTGSKIPRIRNIVFANPRSILRRVAPSMLCVALFALIGGHFAVVQVVAWGQMIGQYSQDEGSVFAGAAKTFSGDAPCNLCKRLSEARTKEDQRPAALKADKRIDAFVVLNATLVTRPPSLDFDYLLSSTANPPSRTDAPPAPVPLA